MKTTRIIIIGACLGLLPIYTTLAKDTKTLKSRTSTQTGIIDIQSTQEFKDLLSAQSIVVAEFYYPSCGHCKNMEPIIQEIAADSNVIIAKVNRRNLAQLTREYSVHSTPTFIFFKNGNTTNSIVGEMNKSELQQEIDTLKE